MNKKQRLAYLKKHINYKNYLYKQSISFRWEDLNFSIEIGSEKECLTNKEQEPNDHYAHKMKHSMYYAQTKRENI